MGIGQPAEAESQTTHHMLESELQYIKMNQEAEGVRQPGQLYSIQGAVRRALDYCM